MQRIRKINFNLVDHGCRLINIPRPIDNLGRRNNFEVSFTIYAAPSGGLQINWQNCCSTFLSPMFNWTSLKLIWWSSISRSNSSRFDFKFSINNCCCTKRPTSPKFASYTMKMYPKRYVKLFSTRISYIAVVEIRSNVSLHYRQWSKRSVDLFGQSIKQICSCARDDVMRVHWLALTMVGWFRWADPGNG